MNSEQDSAQVKEGPDFAEIDRFLLCGTKGASESITGKADPRIDRQLEILYRAFSEERARHFPDVQGAWERRFSRINISATPVRNSQYRMAFIGALMAVVCLVAGLWHFGSREKPFANEISKEYVTTAGQRANLRLDDGTDVVLAPASRLRYVYDPVRSSRDVYLEGEAYFTVAHDPRHPFTVFAGNTSTRVLGTGFGVRSYSDDRAVQVFVAQGRVAFSGAGVLSPGDHATLNTEGEVTLHHGVDIELLRGWTLGRLTFQSERFGDVIPQLERWYGLTIQVLDPAINEIRFTGVFEQQSISNIIAVLSATLEVRVEERGRVITLSHGIGAE
jgi:transmembrane sensor